MRKYSVRPALHAEHESVVSTIVMAFSGDPAARWIYPDSGRYLTCFPEFVKAFAGRAFAARTAHLVDGVAAAALWLPPDIHPDQERIGEFLERTIRPEIKDEAFAVFDAMAQFHPAEPHWYLPMIGVDLPFQGRGFGSALLHHALATCDKDQVPAYLESSNATNIPLYRRHGFKLIGTIQHGNSPAIFPMLRNPQ